MTSLDLIVGALLLTSGVGIEHMRIRFALWRKKRQRRRVFGWAR